MYCRNFFKFAFVCSAFQMLCGGLPAIAYDVSENSDVKIVDPQYVESKGSNDSSNVKNETLEKIDPSENLPVSNEENLVDDNSLVEISVLPDEGQSIKEIKIQICFEDSENTKKFVDSKKAADTEDKFKRFEKIESESSVAPEVSKPLSGPDESLIQAMKNGIQKRKNAIVAMYGSLGNSLNETYQKGNSKAKELLDFLKSCELTMKIVTDDDQKTLQIDLKSPAPVNETVLLEKTPLDEKNNHFIEVNLKNC